MQQDEQPTAIMTQGGECHIKHLTNKINLLDSFIN